MFNLITWLLDRWHTWRQERVEVQLRVHRANLLGPRPEDCYFLNVLNASPTRPVQVTHVWIEAPTGHVTYLNLARLLPVTIDPRHEWETWVPARLVPAGTQVETAARAKLADDEGTVIVSTPRKSVPPVGMVPG